MKDYEKELVRLIPEELEYEKQTLKNDFIFGKVMQNKDICIELINLLTGNEIDDTVNINNQKPVKITSDSKGVRYDVYVEDEKNIYDAEMQNGCDKNQLPRRTRYYQGMIDLNLLESGGEYTELKNSYVIFICTYDPFEENLSCYKFENMCANKDGLPLNDGRTIFIFNTKGKSKNVTLEVRQFLEYIETGTVTNEFLQKLDNEVKKARQNKEWRLEYMKTWVREMDIRSEAREEGREEGIDFERIRIIEIKLQKGKKLEAIASEMELDMAEIEDVYEKLMNRKG